MKEMDEAKRELAKILLSSAIHFTHGDEERMYGAIKQILSLQGDNWRIALVRKEGESPETHITKHWCKELDKLQEKITYEADIENWKKLRHWQDKYSWALTGYNKCERDMLKANWVQEVVE